MGLRAVLWMFLWLAPHLMALARLPSPGTGCERHGLDGRQGAGEGLEGPPAGFQPVIDRLALPMPAIFTGICRSILSARVGFDPDSQSGANPSPSRRGYWINASGFDAAHGDVSDLWQGLSAPLPTRVTACTHRALSRRGCGLVIPARRFSPPPPHGEGLGVGGESISVWQSVHWFRTAVLLDVAPGIYLSFI